MTEQLKKIFTTPINFDDKDLVIISLTIIAIVAMFKITAPSAIISNITSGLLGVATGRVLKWDLNNF